MGEFWTNPTLRTIALGSAVLGAVAGALGCFAILRRQSLAGDVVSHCALPGVAIGFLIFGNQPLGILLGACVLGWLSLGIAFEIARRSKVKQDTALAGVLATFFGLGTMLLSYINKRVPGASEVGLERFLFGQTATLVDKDVYQLVVVGSALILLLLLFWKQFKLLAFDRDFAAVQGVGARGFDWLLTGMIVVAIVIGLQAVGVVLMSALLVAPGVAARQWTDRLGRMVGLAAMFGALAGVVGTVASHSLSQAGKSVPTGPTIVLFATLLVVLSVPAPRLRRAFA